MKLPVAFHDLPASEYPFTIEAINSVTGDIVWTRKVTGPESVYVPPLTRMVGAPVDIRLRSSDGSITIFRADGSTGERQQ